MVTFDDLAAVPKSVLTEHLGGLGVGGRQQICDALVAQRHGSQRDEPQVGRGMGIGLALVKQVAEAHGRISVESPLPDGSTGTRFTMTFRP